MRLAYADPPYPGYEHYYDDDHPPVNHRVLLGTLEAEYDGWAYSCHSNALTLILPLAPAGTRIGAWIKPFASWKRGPHPSYAWEPILFRSARSNFGEFARIPDFVAANITLERGLTGAKPYDVCAWIFEALGARVDDEFHDLFPGSGAVTRAWEQWVRAPTLTAVSAEATQLKL